MEGVVAWNWKQEKKTNISLVIAGKGERLTLEPMKKTVCAMVQISRVFPLTFVETYYQLDIIFCRPQILVSFDWSRQNTGTIKGKKTQVLRRGHLPIHGTSISHGFGSRRFPIAYLIVDLPNESSKISCVCERTQHGQSLI